MRNFITYINKLWPIVNERNSNHQTADKKQVKIKTSIMTEKENENSGNGFIMWVAYGMVFGAALGTFWGNIALGAGMGIVIGVVVSVILGIVKKRK